MAQVTVESFILQVMELLPASRLVMEQQDKETEVETLLEQTPELRKVAEEQEAKV
jgi:c-di-GMP-related signal transduction protein